jgi:hypothetical protein
MGSLNNVDNPDVIALCSISPLHGYCLRLANVTDGPLPILYP